jgi:hypothetical protein
MAVIKQGGSNPHEGQVMTTMGYRAPRPPICRVCGERREGLYTINGYGQEVCPVCAGEKNADALRQSEGEVPIYGEGD